MKNVYFDLLPIDLTAYLQLFIDNNSLSSWFSLIRYSSRKKYWELFYSLFIKDWKTLIEAKPPRLSYKNQYTEFLKLNPSLYGVMDAVFQGRLDQIVYLYNRYGNYVDVINIFNHGMSVAAHVGNSKIIKYLISVGLDINTKSIFYDYKKRMNAEDMSITGLSLHYFNLNSETPLLTAIRSQKSNIIKMLLEMAANPNIDDYLLISSIVMLDIDLFKLIIDQGVDVNKIPPHCDCSMLIYSLGYGIDKVKYLVENGADIGYRGPDGLTALEYSRQHNVDVEIIEYLESLENQK